MFSKKITKIMVLSLVFLFAFTMIVAAEGKSSEAIKGTPTIDGDIEDAWGAAKKISLELKTGEGSSSVWGKLMWDETNLYVLVNITDPVLDDASGTAHEKDSVEIYIDQNNAKASTYEADDMQLRVNFKNEVSSGGTYYDAVKDNIKTAAKVVDDGFIVEAAIPWNAIEPTEGAIIGFDLQYNDAENGARHTVWKWNDTTDTAWQNTSVFGEVKLVGAGGGGLATTGSSVPVYVYYGLAVLLIAGGILMQVRRHAVSR